MNRCRVINRSFILSVLLILSTGRGYTQAGDMIIDQSFHGEMFADLVSHLEGKTDLRFFYDPSWIDTLRLVQAGGSFTLEDLLDASFKERDIKYIITPQGDVILSKGNPIHGSVAKDFFMIPDQGAMASLPDPPEILPLPGQNNGIQHHPDNGLVELGDPAMKNKPGRVDLSGFIKEFENGAPMVGAIVYVEELGLGAATDMNGYYLISLPRGAHKISFQSLGKEKIALSMQIYSSSEYNVDLKDKLTELKAVEIVADKYQNVSGIQTGIERMEISRVKSLPGMMGETDIVKVALLLPGVQTVGEASSGFHVRGGTSDQNLVLFNHAPVFNSSHLFGFFSSFNPDVIKNFELFKSGMPARYGGRVSSVLDIATKQGNMKKTSVSAGISPITGRILVEGPIIKDKLSYLIGGRATYSDWILNRINIPAIRNSNAGFYDLTGKLSCKINNKNFIDVSAYYSRDNFQLNSDTTYRYNNESMTASWKHYFSEKFISEFRAVYSGYNYSISSQQQNMSDFSLDYGIKHHELKSEFSYFLNHRHILRFGANGIFYLMNPNEFRPVGEASDIIPLVLEKEQAFESGIYLSDEYDIGPRLKLYGGIRYSFYQFVGPKTVYRYGPGTPLDPSNINDTINYPSGKIIQSYHHPEFRLSVRYKFNPYNSIKFSYNSNAQYLHMLSNSAIISPTDRWKLSDPHISPQIGDQLSLGYYRDLPYNIETSVETYYKRIKNLLEYKGGAKLINNEHIETDIINGMGKAYGIELIVRKNRGRLTGWLSYTYSRSFIKVDTDFDFEDINNGAYYPSHFDKPHDVSAVFNMVISRRLNFSSNLVYNTGRPITYPIAKFPFKNGIRLHYSERNAYRIPDYFRWDLSLNLEGNLRSRKIAHSSWTFALYNATGRDNVYSIFFISKGKEIQGYKMSIFAVPVFTVTYNIRF
ncbi:MAG: hypothetical protein AMS26_10010 [Bacteroides sp. SM23_62]|nr:MAG: hypothetical protein AMS26_10010 [Bacteroides sp. SM23_62]